MEAVAFAIGLDPILTRGQQLVEQYKTWRDNRRNAPELCNDFVIFEMKLEKCITDLQTEASKLPERSRDIIENDISTLSAYLTAARVALQRINRMINGNRILQFLRANAVAKDCDTIGTKLDKARELLRDTVKHTDQRSSLARIEARQSQRSTCEIIKEGQDQACVDRFRAYVPPLSTGEQAVLDFKSTDEDGSPKTPEGRVKNLLVEASGSGRVICIHGMGGVGKSTIMRSLCDDDEFREYFADGVHMIRLGEDASSATLFREICQVLENSGAEKTVESLRMRNDVDEALSFVEKWFDGKRCALLIDDLWVHGVGLNLISRVCKMGSRLSGSCVVMTTREHEVASLSPRERIVQLEPREARGEEARRILFFHADVKDADECTTSVNDCIDSILDICDGLPVCLAAAGKNVKMISMSLPSEKKEAAWKYYLSEVSKAREMILHENVGQYGNLFATIATSIVILEQKRREGISGFTPSLSFGKMYRRLCVLKKQGRAPSVMLKHLWEVESLEEANKIARRFTEAGLANREIKGGGEESVWYLSIHDSLHDFAVSEAKRHVEMKEAHECVLNGYSCVDSEICCKVRGTSRWWSARLERDGYIHGNVCRHLVGAGRAGEAIKLLLSPKWAKRQLEVNDILYLEADFSVGLKAVEEGMSDARDCEVCDLGRALSLISETFMLSSPFISKDTSELWFQLQGRLRRYGERCRVIGKYVERIEIEGERPLMLCKNSFLVEAGGPNTKIINVGVGVNCMALLKDEELVACGCEDGRIYIANVARSAIEKQWKAHDYVVSAIAVSGDGTRVVSGSWNGAAKVFDIKSGDCLTVFSGHTSSIWCIAIMKDGNRMICGCEDGTVQVLNMERGEGMSNRFTAHEGAAECLAISGDGEEVVTGGEDKKLRMWNVMTGAQVGDTFDGHEGAVECVAVTPDGKRIVSGSWDKTVRVWDVGSHQQIGTLLERSNWFVNCVAVSEDGRRVVSGALHNTIEVWDLESQEQVCEPLKGHTNRVNAVSFLGGSDRILSSSRDGTVRGWDMRRMKTERHTHRRGPLVWSLSFTPDGKYLISGGSDCTLRIWDTKSGEQVGDPLKGHSHLIVGVSVSANGRWVVSVSYDKTVRVWDLESRELLQTLTGHTDCIECIAMTPEGSYIVTGSQDQTVRVWDMTAMNSSHVVLEEHSDTVRRVFVTDDGLRIVSVDSGDNIFVWDIETKKLERQYRRERDWDLSRREILNVVGETTVHDDTKLSIPICGREIVYGDSEDATVLATMESDILSWALSPDKKTVCVGLRDGQIGLMKLER